MIEQPTGLPWGPSLFESLLAQHLLEHRGLRIFFDGPLHRVAGSLPHAAEELDADGLELDDRFPGLNRFGRLLEVGAGHLEAARAAYREQGKQAAVQARALAAFAAARPAALLDRPDEEVGAAAAASRAARPAALTEVSEWAVDEVMVAFGLT